MLVLRRRHRLWNYQNNRLRFVEPQTYVRWDYRSSRSRSKFERLLSFHGLCQRKFRSDWWTTKSWQRIGTAGAEDEKSDKLADGFAGCRAFSDSNQCRSRNPARRRIRHRQFVTTKQSFLKAMKKKSTEARVAAVDRFAELARPETADFLIDLLLKTEGLIQHDVIQYLTRLTSQKFRNHDQEWKIWWTENRSEFDFPPLGDVLPEVIQGEQIRTDYGIPICAKRMVFVLDTSDSMRGQPIERAKQDDVST
jgi:hypothetical protein